MSLNETMLTSDKLAALSKEAESLKTKLEEERHKLNDISRNNRFFVVNHNPFRPFPQCPLPQTVWR